MGYALSLTAVQTEGSLHETERGVSEKRKSRKRESSMITQVKLLHGKTRGLSNAVTYIIIHTSFIRSEADIHLSAKDICKDNMFGKYHVIDVNCQTLVNLLIQRIATGEPYTPKRTASHTFSAGPANKNLVGIWEADKTPAEKLRLKAETQTANQIAFNTQQPGVPAQQSFSIGRSAIGFEFDLSKANIGDHPLTLEEQRLNAYYLSNPLDGNSGPPPPQEQNSGYVESQVSYSTLDMKGRAEAFKRSTEKHFQEVFTRARGLNSLAEGLTAYDDPKISLERREEKRKHLAELNSRYLRSKREAQLKRTSQSGRLAQIKASGKWEEHPPEQLQQCLESWRLADEHDDNPEIIDKGEFPDHLNAPGSNRAWPSREM
jgi:hypothetical protein